MNLLGVASIISAWLLGIFTQNMTNDSEARVLCRRHLLNLKNNLEELSLQQTFPQRRENEDPNKIEQIKNIIGQIEVEYANFFIGIPSLKELIDESEKNFVNFKKNPNEAYNLPHNVGRRLLDIWGTDVNRDYEASKIKDIRSLLDAILPIRIWNRIKSCQK